VFYVEFVFAKVRFTLTISKKEQMTVKLNTILNLLVRQTFTLRKKAKMPRN